MKHVLSLPLNFFANLVLLPPRFISLVGLFFCLPNASAYRRIPYKMEAFPVRHSFPPCKKSAVNLLQAY